MRGARGGSTAERAEAARPGASRSARPRPQFHPGGVCIVPPLSVPPPDFPKDLFLKIFWGISQKGFI